MLKIRLRRIGKKKQPYYRIVVAEHTAPIYGAFVGMVGHYDPRTKKIVLNQQEIEGWLGKGAQPSNTVAKLLTAAGFKHKNVVVKLRQPKAAKKAAKTETKPAEQPAKESQPETEVAIPASEDKTEPATPPATPTPPIEQK